jgi:hypothetical protein
MRQSNSERGKMAAGIPENMADRLAGPPPGGSAAMLPAGPCAVLIRVLELVSFCT